MILHMQRSSSLPGPCHEPVSPPVTRHSSRSNTPAPLLRPINTQQFSRDIPNIPRETKHTNAGTEELKLWIPEQPAPTAQEAPESTPPSLLRPSLIPLIQDASQYTNVNMSEMNAGSASTTLEELAHLVRLSAYQERKRSQSRVRLQRFLVSTALSARLARCGELAHRTLVDNFRADDKKSFANLYNAIDDVKKSCDAMRRYSVLEPDLDIGRPTPRLLEEQGSASTFLHEIPTRSRDVLLDLLTQIRTVPDFLAIRLCNLTRTELSALSHFHQGLEPIDSVLPFHTRLRGQNQSSNRASLHLPSPVERLLSFQRHDPLSALIYTCFANSAGPDSDEDVRRTDVWATVCARMITEKKTGADPFICTILNIWSTMREWSSRGTMEWYLMKILEDGAFLLEKAEDQAGTRIHVEPRNAKDSIAADEFYEAAIKGLFEVVDSPGAGGIPEGLLELGNAILRKVDAKKQNATRAFLISKWLFSVFLVNVVVHPETYGMMSEYHITEYGRQKILKEVALRATRLVVDLMWKQSAATPPDVRIHIENIINRFRPSRSRPAPKLLPARSITSLRETVEVHPYLVISPADLVTIVNALHPERRPASSAESHRGMTGLRSTASSISGMSDISNNRDTFDAASMINAEPSVFCNDPSTFSHEPLRPQETGEIPLLSEFQVENESWRLRTAIREMSQTLGFDAAAGSCHPCAEQWAVVFLDPSGQQLSTQMVHDLDVDGEDEEYTSSSDSDHEMQIPRTDLDKDYHQLRDSILKLVEDYEIPHSLSPKKSKTFSNRVVSVESPGKNRRPRSRANPQSPESQSRNPYRSYQSPSLVASSVTSPIGLPHKRTGSTSSADISESRPPLLLRMLEAAEKQCQAQSDFVNAHLYWKTAQQLHQISSPSLIKNGYVSLLNIFSRGPRDSIRRSASAIEEHDAWLVWLKQSQERHDISIEVMMKKLRSLRDKIWYVTDVRNSAAYEAARNVAIALKSMASPRKAIPPAGMRPRNASRLSSNAFLLKTEAQIFDIIAAPEEHGGPNKLSDDQTEKTITYLSQFGIENFCKGEERIHRFCLEVETCVNKLVGDSLMDGPVLWSSELYARDRKVLDDGRQKGDLMMNGMGTLSIAGDKTQDSDHQRRSFRAMDMPPGRAGVRDLRSMSGRNGSQQSLDSGMWSGRASIAGDIMDSNEYFGAGSPVLSLDSTTTFWSPFQTQVQSPSTSVSNFRPSTASTTNNTVLMKGSEMTGTPKLDFLSELKRTLTSLLISDLGTLVFARGSETDSWFSGDLGMDCMERREQSDRSKRRTATTTTTNGNFNGSNTNNNNNRRRVIEKKKSFRDLRSVHNIESSPASEGRRSHDTLSGSNSAAEALVDNPAMSVSTSTIDSATTGSQTPTRSESSSLDFPYKASFQRLLRMFSVHPNPYAKLNALYELEQLIVASLTTLPRRRTHRHDRMRMGGSGDFREGHGVTGRGGVLNEAMDNVRERRLSTIRSEVMPSHSRHSFDHRPMTSRSMSTPNSVSTDAIVDVLQDLFRDPAMLPKTLFRDLQFIAAFVPAHILDKTDRGKAFWDTGLAALGLKQDICHTLIEIADEIVLHYTQKRQTTSTSKGDSRDPSTGNSQGGFDADLMKYSFQDAAKMWTITAKEGDPVAERELATFYLTHPELVEKTTLPLTKPRDTFKTMSNGGGGVGGWVGGIGGGMARESEGDRERSDPATMCVAYHWMELSSLGGDELANKYLRQREELNALP